MRKLVPFAAALCAGLFLAGATALAAGGPSSNQAGQCQSLLSQFKQEAPAKGHSAAWTLWAAANESCQIGRYNTGIKTVTEAMQQVGLHPKV